MKKISTIGIIFLVLVFSLSLTSNALAQDSRGAQQQVEQKEEDKTPEEPGANIEYIGGPDGYGYNYIDSLEPGGPTYAWIDAVTGGTNLGLDDTTETNITLPFSFTYYGTSSTAIRVGNNGAVLFNATTGEVNDGNSCPLSGSTTNNIIAPWWDDWATTGDVYWQTFGTEPNRYVVIEWYNMQHYSAGAGDYATFELIFFEGSIDVVFQYLDTDVTGTLYDNGLSGTAGIRQATTLNSLQYRTCNASSLASDLAVRFIGPVVPDLSTSIKTAPGTVLIGDVITYSVHIANTGLADAEDASMVDAVPVPTTYVVGSLECSVGVCQFLSATSEISWTGSISVGASAIVTFAVDTDAISCGSTIINTALLDDPALIGLPVSVQAATQVVSYLPFLMERFENTAFPPAGWARYQTGDASDPGWILGTGTGAHTGTGYAWHNDDNLTTSAISWLVSPQFVLPPGAMPVLSFWERTVYTGYANYHGIWVSTGSGNPVDGAFVELQNFTGSKPTTWTQHNIDMTTYVGQSVYIAFRYEGDYADEWYLDDITVAEPWSPCPYVSIGPDQAGGTCRGSSVDYEVPVSNITSIPDTLDLSWLSGWPSTVLPDTFVLGAGESSAANVSVYIPWSAPAGTSDTATITALGQTSGFTDSVQINTTSALAAGYTDYTDIPSTSGYQTRDHSVVYFDGKLYKFGGYGGTGAAQAFTLIYDIATNTWTTGDAMPAARYWIDCVEINGLIYCAGGYMSAGVNTLYIYNPAAAPGSQWTAGATLPAARYGYSGVASNGRYYVIGGYTTSYQNTIIVYDPVANTWDSTRASMSVPRRYAAAGEINGLIYVSGGLTSGSAYSNTTEVYDPVANTWSPRASLPAISPFGGSTTGWVRGADGVKHDRYLVWAGGSYVDSGATNAVLVYDAVNDEWAFQPAYMAHIFYGAEGDVDANGNFWFVSGRIYEGGAFGYSRYTTQMVQCAGCTPASGLDFMVVPSAPRPGVPATFDASVAAGSPTILYTWDFGDTGNGVGEIITHTFATAGTYTVTLTASNCDGSTVLITSHAITVMAGALIDVNPTELSSTQCANTVVADTLDICNNGDIPLTWDLSEAPPVPWLSALPISGTVGAGICQTVDVGFDSTGLAPGIYSSTLEIANNDILNPLVVVPVGLVVPGAPTAVDFAWDPLSPNLYQDVTFTGQVTALLPVTYTWDFGDGNSGSGQVATHAYNAWGDFTVSMTAEQCGYQIPITHTLTVASCWSLVNENFEGTFPPSGWTVQNNGGTCDWTRNDAFAVARPNYAGGQGFCADADSDKCGSGTTMDTELRTMTLDLSTVTSATLSYITSYNDIGTGGDYGDVDISLDGGISWVNLVHWDADHSPNGPGEAVALNLTPYVGYSNVMLRFHYYLATYDWWYEVDQVQVLGCYVPGAAPDILVTPQALTQTLLHDQTASQVFNIANVGLADLSWVLDEGCGTPVSWLSVDPITGTLPATFDEDVTLSFDSTSLATGTYNTSLCITSNDPDEPNVNVAVALIVAPTPNIVVDAPPLEADVCPASTEVITFTVCNTGDGVLTWDLVEMPAGIQLVTMTDSSVQSPSPDRPTITSEAQCAAYTNFNGLEPLGYAEFCMPGFSPPVASNSIALAPTDSGYAQDIGYVSDNFVSFALNDFSGQTVVGTNANAYYGMDFDPTATILYALNDTTDQLGTIDLTTGAFTPLVSCPPGGGAANWTGLSIDPVTGVFYGSTALDLYLIDPETGISTLIGPFGTTLMIEIAIGPDGLMYGHDIGTDSIYQINVATGAAALIGLTGYAANFAQGLDFDNQDGTLYIFLYQGSGANVYGTVDLLTGAVTPLAVSSPLGEFEGATQTTIPTVDIPWLSENPISGTVPGGLCTTVEVTFDSDALGAGTYHANLQINSDDLSTPEITLPVTMTVLVPPSGADFTWSPVEPKTGETVTFTGTISTGDEPFTWNWLFGDSGIGNGQVVTHVYDDPDAYIVTLTVANQCGAASMQHSLVATPNYIEFTYHDLEDVINIGEPVTIRGDFNDWGTVPITMTPNADYSVFTALVPIAMGSYEYKYYMPSLPSLANYDMLNTSNRILIVSGDSTVDDYRDVSIGWAHLGAPVVVTITLGENSGDLVGEVYVQNVTNYPGEGRRIAAQLGYGLDPNPANWTWVEMTYTGDDLYVANDLYAAVITPTTTSTYTFGVRFDGNWGTGNPNIGWTLGDRTGLLVVLPPEIGYADLEVTKEAPAAVKVGATFTYTITITNAGPDNAAGVEIVDTLPASVTFVSASAGCVHVSGVVTCTLGEIAAGDDITLYIIVTAPVQSGSIINSVVVSSDANDPDPINNTATVEVVVEPLTVLRQVYLLMLMKDTGVGR